MSKKITNLLFSFLRKSQYGNNVPHCILYSTKKILSLVAIKKSLMASLDNTTIHRDIYNLKTNL